MWLSPIQKQTQHLLSQGGRRCFHASPGRQGQFFPQMPQGYKIKRFYKRVEIEEHPLTPEALKLPQGEKVDFKNLSFTGDRYWAVTLDGKVTKTMYKDNLLIPSKAMAVALAEEWESQQDHINLKSLHLVSPHHSLSFNSRYSRTISLPSASGRLTTIAYRATCGRSSIPS